MTEDVLAQARDKMRRYGIVDSGDAATSWPGRHDRQALGRLLRHRLRPGGRIPRRLDFRRAYTLRFLQPAGAKTAVTIAALGGRRGRLSGARRRRWGRSTSAWRPARSSPWSGPRAAASPRPCGCWRAWRRRRRGAVTRAAGRGETAVVFQAPTLAPWLTAVANVALPLELAGARRARRRETRAAAALARVGLAGAVKRAAGAAFRRHGHARVPGPGAGHPAQGAAAGRAVRGPGRDHPPRSWPTTCWRSGPRRGRPSCSSPTMSRRPSTWPAGWW